MKRETRLRLLAVLAGAFLLMGCEAVKIADVKANPSKYSGKTVKVAGRVTTSFGVLSTGGYEIQDDSGRIFVISNHGVPAQGANVVVEGSVFSGAMIAGQPVGVAIRESKHEVR